MSTTSGDERRRDLLESFERLMQHVARWRQMDLAG